MFATPRNHGLVSGTGDDLRHGDHLARVGEPDEPALAAATTSPSRDDLDLRGRLAREPGRQLLLERAKIESGGAGHGVAVGRSISRSR